MNNTMTKPELDTWWMRHHYDKRCRKPMRKNLSESRRQFLKLKKWISSDYDLEYENNN